MRKSLPILLLAATLVLPGCETSDEDEWNTMRVKPFDQATSTCEEQTEALREGSDREAFYIDCMEALGWTPEAD